MKKGEELEERVRKAGVDLNQPIILEDYQLSDIEPLIMDIEPLTFDDDFGIPKE
jgi:hypothetical protein